MLCQDPWDSFSIVPPIACSPFVCSGLSLWCCSKTTLRLLELLCYFVQRAIIVLYLHPLQGRPYPITFQYMSMKPSLLAWSWTHPEAYFTLHSLAQDLYLCRASSIPYPTCPPHFPVSAWEYFLHRWLNYKSLLGVFFWGTQTKAHADPHQCWILWEARSLGLINVTGWLSSRLLSLKILSLILHVKQNSKTYLTMRHMAESNFREKSREVIRLTCYGTYKEIKF